MRIVNLYRKETNNRGDLMSAPGLYLGESGHEISRLDITGWKRDDPEARSRWMQALSKADLIVVGGGGLLEFPKHADSIEFISRYETSAPKVIWGAGHNGVELGSWSNFRPKFSGDYSGFDLVGVRDFGHAFEWVPCASCMHPALDQEYEVEREFTFFVNRGVGGPSQYFPTGVDADDLVSNLSTPMEDIVAELAKGETVITSSYHGAYWATLLGRKVVSIPTSSKFYGLKHAVPFCHASDWQRFVPLARAYPEALSECRSQTREFQAKALGIVQ